MHIEVLSPGDDVHAVLGDRLMAFNIQARPHAGWGKDVFTVVLRDESGEVRGGARGVVRMGAVDLRKNFAIGSTRIPVACQ